MSQASIREGTSTYLETAAKASGVGLLIDRCVRSEQPIGTVWLVDDETVVTCAHLVVLYKDFLRGLKVYFPASNQTWEIVEAVFHPRFDIQIARDMAMRSLTAPVPALALQDYNMVLLKLTRTVSHLNRDDATTFNKKLSLAPMPRLKGLAGAVEEIGLALVMQTVSNTRKDGVLFIADERNRPLSRLFFKDGRIAYAKFGKLSNEAAVYQLFQQSISGQFQFRQQPEPDWPVSEPMNRSTESLLLEAHRRLDESPAQAQKLGGPTAAMKRSRELLDIDSLPPEVVPDAQRLWPYLDGGTSADQMWEIVHLDNYSVFVALSALLATEQVEVVEAPTDTIAPTPALPVAAYELLAPWDEVVSLTVHPQNGRAQMRTGRLVGLLRPNDPYHLLHNLNLPYKAAGSPILKGGKIIGMHCGMLPLDPQLHALPHHLYQFIWVDALNVCLAQAGKPTSERKKSVGMKRITDASDKGKIVCSRCQSFMVKEARFCGTCGEKIG